MRVTAYCIWLCGIGFPQGYKKRHYMNEQQREARRQELLKQTLFYKGEESCPETIAQGCLYWDYDNYWGGGREPVTMEDVRQFCDKYKQTYNELQKK